MDQRHETLNQQGIGTKWPKLFQATGIVLSRLESIGRTGAIGFELSRSPNHQPKRLTIVTVLDVMALVVLAMMVAMVVALFVVLGSLPGQIAKKRGHPNAKAIQIGGWATLLLAVVGWPFVLMWAMSEPAARLDPKEGNSNDQDFDQQIGELKQRLATLESKLEEV